MTLPIDVITSASTDAIDVTTSASRHNEAATLHIESRVDVSDDDTLSFAYGGHREEWFASVFGGVGYTRELAQYISRTKTTLRASYRFYEDDYDVRAHTLRGEVYQSVTDWAYINVLYRAHCQTAVYFWTSNPGLSDLDVGAPRTSDSDLARFWAQKWGVKAAFQLTPPGRGHQHELDVCFNRYTRSNDLSVNVASVG